MMSVPALAEPLTGLYNTGFSELEGAGEASLNIRFHACDDDAKLTCATVIEVLKPVPGAPDIIPDGRPILGLTMITGLKDKGNGKYRGGRVIAVDMSVKEQQMKVFGLKLTNLFDGTLEAKGCLGPICPRTMIWTAIDEEATPVDAAANEAVSQD